MVKVIVFCILFVIFGVMLPCDAILSSLIPLGPRLHLRERNQRLSLENHLRMYQRMTRGLVTGYISESLGKQKVLLKPQADIYKIYAVLSKLPVSFILSVGNNGGQRKYLSNLESSPSLVSDCSHNHELWLKSKVKSKEYIEVNTESPMNIDQRNYPPTSGLTYLPNEGNSLIKQMSVHLLHLNYKSNQDDVDHRYASSNYAPVIIFNNSNHMLKSDKQTFKDTLANLSLLKLGFKYVKKNDQERFEIIQVKQKEDSKSWFKTEESVDQESGDTITSDISEGRKDLKPLKRLTNPNYLKEAKRGKRKGQDSIESLFKQNKVKLSNDAKNKPFKRVVKLKLLSLYSLIKNSHFDDSSSHIKIYLDAIVADPLVSDNWHLPLNRRDVLESIPILVPDESFLSIYILPIIRYLSQPLPSSDYLLSHLSSYDELSSSYDFSSSGRHLGHSGFASI